jgi:hypothetical protein
MARNGYLKVHFGVNWIIIVVPNHSFPLALFPFGLGIKALQESSVGAREELRALSRESLPQI